MLNLISSTSRRYLSSTSNPSVVVFGGNGWVGSFVVQSLLKKNADVTIISRSGPKSNEEWHSKVNFQSFDLNNSSKDDLLTLLQENNTTGVVSCVGTFGEPGLDQDSMFQQNGLANSFLAETSKEAGVEHFSYISAHQFPIAKQTVMKGYYRGKLHAEAAIQSAGFKSSTILRPGFISGTRNGIPLWIAGTPMSTMFRTDMMQSVRDKIPNMVGDFLETPIDVADVGVVAAMGALGEIDQVGAGVYGDLDPLNGREIARLGELYNR
jgi:nucleoside-diphosphate-sugar epimerase